MNLEKLVIAMIALKLEVWLPRLIVTSIVAVMFFTSLTRAEPPYSGTIFIEPNIIINSDRSTFEGLVASGIGVRTVYDRRVNDWIEINAFLFLASYEDAGDVEIQVNPEFQSLESAQAAAEKYAYPVGQVPMALKKDLDAIWIHKGNQLFGGGNRSLLIHTDYSELNYEDSGILEETIVHELAHTSLDSYYASDPSWLEAQTADGEFISTYARDYPLREDVAESFLMFLATMKRGDQLPPVFLETIRTTIPNRLTFFSKLELELYPFLGSGDIDDDGIIDGNDAFPLDATESQDSDSDGVGDNADAFDLDASESVDTDGDGVGNNADLDDDGDGFTDKEELADGTNPLNRFSCKSGCFSFDVDENLEAQPLTDGLLVIRHLFGFSGDSLISGAVSGEANRDSSEAIAGYLTDADSELDIDGDGESKPLTDGLLLIRYLFGFSGDSLISGAIGSGAERDTADEVEAYIEARLPPSP